VKKFLPVLVAALITVSCGSDSKQRAVEVGSEIAVSSMANLEFSLGSRVRDLGPLGVTALTPSGLRRAYESTGTVAMLDELRHAMDFNVNPDPILRKIRDTGDYDNIDWDALQDNDDLKTRAVTTLAADMHDIDREMQKMLQDYEEGMNSLTETFGKEEAAIINMAAAVDVIDLVTDAKYFEDIFEKLPQSRSALTLTEFAELVKLAKLADPLAAPKREDWNCIDSYVSYICSPVKSFAERADKLIKELDPHAEIGS